MYFCPRKNGPVEERVQLFSAIHLKLAKKSKKLSNFFQQQKCLKTKMSCTRLHQTPFALILLEFGFKRNMAKEKDF
jgi:hypothetical protein